MICKNCRECFDEARRVTEVEEAWGRPYIIPYAVCPFCRDSDLDEEAECEECGNAVPESELIDGYCETCRNV